MPRNAAGPRPLVNPTPAAPTDRDPRSPPAPPVGHAIPPQPGQTTFVDTLPAGRTSLANFDGTRWVPVGEVTELNLNGDTLRVSAPLRVTRAAPRQSAHNRPRGFAHDLVPDCRCRLCTSIRAAASRGVRRQPCPCSHCVEARRPPPPPRPPPLTFEELAAVEG